MKDSRGQFVAKNQWLWLLASTILLGGAAAESTKFRPPPDATEYRQRVTAAKDALPLDLGDWQGKITPVEQSAVKLLRPNFIISRQYINYKIPLSVGFLFVECQDARDTVGHYPPICYPSQGWSLQLHERKDWTLPNMTIHGTEYTFVRGDFDSSGTQVVDDFFVIPGVGTRPDRESVIAAAADLQRRFYGVAQVQLVFYGESTREQREQAFKELVGPLENLIQTVQTVQPGGAMQSPGATNPLDARDGVVK
jgi:Protein of unknown function (DUF3485)